VRAICAQRQQLDQRYAPWRVDRTYVGAIERFGSQVRPVFETGDDVVPAACDRPVELAALALQVVHSDDQPTRLEAMDVLTAEVGADEATDLLLSEPLPEDTSGGWMTNLGHNAAVYLGVLTGPSGVTLQ
jgi:hypothetical protein